MDSLYTNLWQILSSFRMPAWLSLRPWTKSSRWPQPIGGRTSTFNIFYNLRAYPCKYRVVVHRRKRAKDIILHVWYVLGLGNVQVKWLPSGCDWYLSSGCFAHWYRTSRWCTNLTPKSYANFKRTSHCKKVLKGIDYHLSQTPLCTLS